MQTNFRELILSPLSGLYRECHHVNYEGLVNPAPIRLHDKFGLRSLNDIWWNRALGRDSFEQICEQMRRRYKFSSPPSSAHRAILSDPELFWLRLQDSPKVVANLGSEAKKLFSALETIQIYCDLYSDYISNPFILSIQEGLVVNELCSKHLLSNALLVKGNPYLEFLEEWAKPAIMEMRADMAWIVGPVKMSTLAMACWCKEANPTCHVAVTSHASEYYSLTKIKDHLKQNEVLFSVIDSVILDEFSHTEPLLTDCIRHKQPLSSVPNILYVDHSSGATSSKFVPKFGGKEVKGIIKETEFIGVPTELIEVTQRHGVGVAESKRVERHVDAWNVADIRMWPNAKCYWDSCNFCAINRKYETIESNSFVDARKVALHMKKLADEGVKYLWSFDEAIPPKSLGELAFQLIAEKVDIKWQTRSKIDKNFTEEICSALGKAGLREIRLGLESAVPRVLSAMGKFPAGWSLELVDEIVGRFHRAGVSVHFPTIVGFPTETIEERNQTYLFLGELHSKYPTFTFNINVLGLDVASQLYKNFADFGITTVRWPTSAKYFLGNLVDWECAEYAFDYHQCDVERNDVMRSILYPWMPSTASLPTYIFYRLGETSRATMVWKDLRAEEAIAINKPGPELVNIIKSKEIVITAIDGDKYDIYSWNTHHNFQVDGETLELISSFTEPKVQALDKEFEQECQLLLFAGVLETC